MAVIAVLGVVLAMAASMCVAGRSRLARFSEAALAHSDATRAAGMLARDIRAARQAREDRGALALRGGEAGEVRWEVRGGRLARLAGGERRTFRCAVSSMRVGIADGLVEVGLRTTAPAGQPTMPLYVAARPRAAGDEP